MKILSILFFLFPIIVAAQIDSKATYETRALYQNLMDVSQENLLFGHQDDLAYGIGWWAVDGRSDVKEVCGDYPAVYGWDIGDIHKSENLDGVNFENMKGWIREAYSRGGINTISIHLDNPVTGGNAWDNAEAVPYIIPGGDLHEAYTNTLNMIGTFLNDLKTEDSVYIPIIIRPYHEHNQTWPWWGTGSCSEEEFIELWKMTVHYFKDTLNIHHLLYAISPQDVTSASGYFSRYPGDDYVDILGLDYYNLTSSGQISTLANTLDMLGKEAKIRGKITALTETGIDEIPIKTWWTDYLYETYNYSEDSRRTAWALVWRNKDVTHYFAPYAGEASADNFVEFYDKPDSYFESDLPEMYFLSANDSIAPQLTLQTEAACTAYSSPVTIKLISDERAYLRYSFTDKDYVAMEYEFQSGQGGYLHKTDIAVEHGNDYTIYIRASDISDNFTSSSVIINISVDTTKQLLHWNQYNYDDSSWDEGAAPLGFNATGLNTEVTDQQTIYFRKKIALPDSLNGLGLLIKGHDGFVVYSNGVEIDRINMPSNEAIDYYTSAIDDNDVTKVVVFDEQELNKLEKDNIIAIEVHKASGDSMDISFDAQLFNNEGIYLNLGSKWKYYDKGNEPETQILTKVEDNLDAEIPVYFILHQNHPNPFNSRTAISYSLLATSKVDLSIYNVTGQKIRTLVSREQKAGEHIFYWDAIGYASGIYFYKLMAKSQNQNAFFRTRKMILTK